MHPLEYNIVPTHLISHDNNGAVISVYFLSDISPSFLSLLR